MECPVCGGKVELICNGHSHDCDTFIKFFRLKCSKCFLTSREAIVRASVYNDGNVSTDRNELIKIYEEWGIKNG